MLLAELMTDTYQGNRPHYLILTNSFEKFHRAEFCGCRNVAKFDKNYFHSIKIYLHSIKIIFI